MGLCFPKHKPCVLLVGQATASRQPLRAVSWLASCLCPVCNTHPWGPIGSPHPGTHLQGVWSLLHFSLSRGLQSRAGLSAQRGRGHHLSSPLVPTLHFAKNLQRPGGGHPPSPSCTPGNSWTPISWFGSSSGKEGQAGEGLLGWPEQVEGKEQEAERAQGPHVPS